MRRDQGVSAGGAPSALRAVATLMALLVAGGGAGCDSGTGGAPFASAPFVQNVSETRATIAMLTAAPVRLAVDVGPVSAADGPLVRVAEEDAPATSHAVRLIGLEPDRAYRYLVVDADTGAALGGATLRTAPPPGRRPVVFAAFGDSGMTHQAGDVPAPFARFAKRVEDRAAPTRQGDVARAVLARAPDLCLHLGDIVYPDGAREVYAEAFLRPFAPLLATTPMFPSIGNHDVRTEGGAPFDEVFDTPANNPERDERYYSFDYGDVHFVALDSASRGHTNLMEPDSPQLAWLVDDLSTVERAWTIVYFHHPPFAVGRSQGEEYVRTNVLPILEGFGVDLVINGHDHNYTRFLPVRGVTYIIAGGGGAGLYLVDERGAAYAEAVFSFVLGRADARRLDLTAVDLTGRVFDAVTLLKDPR